MLAPWTLLSGSDYKANMPVVFESVQCTSYRRANMVFIIYLGEPTLGRVAALRSECLIWLFL